MMAEIGNRKSDERFMDRVVLVTGASSGLGRAISVAFGRAGAKLVLAARRVDELEKTAEMIRGAGAECICVRADMTQASDVEAMVRQTVGAFGRLDCALNNAGITGFGGGDLHEFSEELWDEIVDTNLKGVWLCMKYEIPEMLKLGRGSIVNMSSVAGLVGHRRKHSSAYAASKHGVVGLTKTGALEYSGLGIRINAVCPGYMRTEENAWILEREDVRDWVIAQHPIGRMGTAEEVADVVLWLSSDEASFVTGHALPVDGGLVAASHVVRHQCPRCGTET